MLPNPRHWPWWGWALCVVATLGTMTLSAALIYRQTGIHLLRAEVARLHAAGYGVVPADLSQQLPLVDRARQNRAWALFGPTGPSWNEPKYPIAGMTEKKSISSASPESTRIERNLEIARNLDDSKTARSEWVTLSTEGPLVLTGLGWLTIDPATSSLADFEANASNCVASLLRIRQLANAFAVESRTATDPRPALVALDTLVAGQDHPGYLIDAMILLSTSQIRDEAWLEAVLRGTDPQPWLANTVPCLTRIADSIAIERMLWCGMQSQRILDGKTPGYNPSTWKSFPRSRSAWESITETLSDSGWSIFAPTDNLWYLRGITECERLSRDGLGDPAALIKEIYDFRWRVLTAAIALPNLAETVKTGARAELKQRRNRLSGALIQFWNTTKSLPNALSELPPLTAQLAIPRADLPVIRYTRVSPTRFLLDSDPATPGTNMVPSGTITAAPTLSGPYLSGQWSLELDLADLEKYP